MHWKLGKTSISVLVILWQKCTLPLRVLPPGKSRWVCADGIDRQTDGRTPDRYIMLSGQRNNGFRGIDVSVFFVVDGQFHGNITALKSWMWLKLLLAWCTALGPTWCSVQSLPVLLRLWYHESQRVFADRLVNDEDRSWFSGLLTERIVADFKTSFDDVVTSDPLLYADFMAGNASDSSRPYVEVTDHDKVRVVHKSLLMIVLITSSQNILTKGRIATLSSLAVTN